MNFYFKYFQEFLPYDFFSLWQQATGHTSHLIYINTYFHYNIITQSFLLIAKPVLYQAIFILSKASTVKTYHKSTVGFCANVNYTPVHTFISHSISSVYQQVKLAIPQINGNPLHHGWMPNYGIGLKLFYGRTVLLGWCGNENALYSVLESDSPLFGIPLLFYHLSFYYSCFKILRFSHILQLECYLKVENFRKFQSKIVNKFQFFCARNSHIFLGIYTKFENSYISSPLHPKCFYLRGWGGKESHRKVQVKSWKCSCLFRGVPLLPYIAQYHTFNFHAIISHKSINNWINCSITHGTPIQSDQVNWTRLHYQQNPDILESFQSC